MKYDFSSKHRHRHLYGWLVEQTHHLSKFLCYEVILELEIDERLYIAALYLNN